MPDRKFERILVAIADPSAGLNKAVRRAGALAHKTGASIELLNAMPSAVSTGIMHAESADRLQCDVLIVKPPNR
jgi:nucleotide-binding universal stress UspA family protein